MISEEGRLRVNPLHRRRWFHQRNQLTEAWLHHADFLTRPYSTGFTHIVGNPPYLRIESLPRPLMQRYRALFRTMYDRADLYIAFFEKGLSLLEPEGKLGYICANRWIKNRYGGPLREMIASAFHLETYVDFTGVDAFHGEVIAYPAVTVIRNGSGRTTRVVEKEDVHCDTLPDLSERLLKHQADPRIKEMDGIADKGAPWLFSNAKRLLVIQHLERSLPTLEEAGCKVGIGVATGADKVYIGTDAELDVEPGRKLPLLTRADLKNNRIEWTGKYVLNPFDGDHPGLVDPDDFPKFKAYLATHRDAIQGRHVAKKNPRAWFKTIDRIYPTLSATPKLVIPDIQGDPQVAYDAGAFYPHHNLYYITSNEWDLRALQTVLRSRLANAFVATYSLRMRGDCLRFQAQYLRRIRLPRWSTLSPDLQTTLKSLAESNDLAKIEIIVRSLYGLDETDWEALCADSPNGRATSVPEPIPLLATASSSKMKKNPDVCPNAATPPSISPPTPYSKLPLTRNACASSANAWFRNAFTPPPPSSPRHPMPPNPVSSVTCPPRLPSAG